MINNLKKAITDFRLKRGFRILSHNLESINSKLNTKQTIDFLFSKKGALITPWQFVSEITSLFELYEGLKVNYAMEIGTANGGTLFGHCKLANENATIISVDLPGGKFGGGYPDWKMPIYKKFAQKNQSLNLIRASSHENSTIQKVKDILKSNKLDYLFIDGDHTYEGVKKDFELYSPFVKKGGVIIFHDIVPHGGSSCKVDEFWNEIKLKYQHKEFIDKPDQDCFGVGVIFLN
jgi:cephalosporin hydroxylase